MEAIVRSLGISAGVFLLLAGCAQNPEHIEAHSVSPIVYAPLNCHEIEQELDQLSTRLNEVKDLQRVAAARDAELLALGILFGPAVYAVNQGSRSNHSEELGRLKGEQDALLLAGAVKNCENINALIAAEAEADAAATASNTSVDARELKRQKENETIPFAKRRREFFNDPDHPL